MDTARRLLSSALAIVDFRGFFSRESSSDQNSWYFFMLFNMSEVSQKGVKAWNIGFTMKLMKPTCEPANETEWRSQRGDSSRPRTRSWSPCAKNSSSTRSVHFLAMLYGLQVLERSAQWRTASMIGTVLSHLLMSLPFSSMIAFRTFRLEKCLAMSVPRTVSTTIFLKDSLCFGENVSRTKLHSARLRIRKVVARCMFSLTLRSLYVMASSSPDFTRKSLVTPGCATS
mmetsp:Transcript_62779/g.141778  ORF Transcript_62779/g.141778 Transcript_62779/m.141778 type:complete len:228 (-) Transcript_62779:826-1509(-)